jgi:hypothetical protein
MNKLESKLKDLNQMLVDDGYNGSNIVIQTLEEIREETINYTRCCKSDSEQLDADFISIVGKEAHYYKDGDIVKREALKFSD